MKSLTLAASLLVLAFCGSSGFAQSIAREKSSDVNDRANAGRAIEQLKRLKDDVIVYRSLGAFEESGKLARVSLQTFEDDLRQVSIEMESILSAMPASTIKTQLENSLASYEDGAYWWRKIDQPRVVSVSMLAYQQQQITVSDSAFASTVPYTVAIHWRQASRYLAQAENSIDDH